MDYMTAGNPRRRRLNDGPTISCGPNFFVIGAQKAGTTRLCNLLQRHPSVAIPFKEPFYFQSPDAMKEKAQWYRSIFKDIAHLPAGRRQHLVLHVRQLPRDRSTRS